MAVDFISSRIPPWKAIKTRLKPPPKAESPIRVNEFTLSQRKIGPGTYSIPILPPISAPHRFPSAPRFSNSEKLSLLIPNLEKKSPSQIIRGKMLYKQNLDPSPHKSDTKFMRLQELSIERSNSLSLAKKTKESIQKKKKQDLIQKLEKREIKFMKWKAAKLFIRAEKGWVLLFSMVFMGQLLNERIMERKRFKSIFVFNSDLLYQVSRAVGRIRCMVKLIRKNKAMKVMKNIFMPIFQMKLNSMLIAYKESIVYTIELCLTRKLIRKICIFWRRKMNKFEAGMRNLVVVHKHRCARLLEMWDEIQQKFNYYSAKVIFPRDVSLKILKKYLYEKLKKFYFAQKDFKDKLNMIKNEASKRSFVRTFQLTQRRNGRRVSIAIRSFMHLRIYNKDELIPLYLEEESKLHIQKEVSMRNSLNSQIDKEPFTKRLSINPSSLIKYSKS